MDRRTRTNLFLAVAVLVLGLLIWLAPGRQTQPAGYRLFEAGSIEHIRVLRDETVHLELRRRDDGWHVAEPVTLPADAFQSAALIDVLTAYASRRYPVAEANLAELGLEDPEWKLQVNDEALVIGGSTALGSNRYLLKGEHIYVVSELFSYHLKRSAWDYVSKRVLPNDTAIETLMLPGGVSIGREGPAWKITPEVAGISSDELQETVTAWRNAGALGVKPAASVPREGEVHVTFENGETLRFGVEIRDDELLLSRDAPAVTYSLPKHSVVELLQPGTAATDGVR